MKKIFIPIFIFLFFKNFKTSIKNYGNEKIYRNVNKKEIKEIFIEKFGCANCLFESPNKDFYTELIDIKGNELIEKINKIESSERFKKNENLRIREKIFFNKNGESISINSFEDNFNLFFTNISIVSLTREEKNSFIENIENSFYKDELSQEKKIFRDPSIYEIVFIEKKKEEPEGNIFIDEKFKSVIYKNIFDWIENLELNKENDIFFFALPENHNNCCERIKFDGNSGYFGIFKALELKTQEEKFFEKQEPTIFSGNCKISNDGYASIGEAGGILNKATSILDNDKKYSFFVSQESKNNLESEKKYFIENNDKILNFFKPNKKIEIFNQDYNSENKFFKWTKLLIELNKDYKEMAGISSKSFFFFLRNKKRYFNLFHFNLKDKKYTQNEFFNLDELKEKMKNFIENLFLKMPNDLLYFETGPSENAKYDYETLLPKVFKPLNKENFCEECIKNIENKNIFNFKNNKKKIYMVYKKDWEKIKEEDEEIILNQKNKKLTHELEDFPLLNKELFDGIFSIIKDYESAKNQFYENEETIFKFYQEKMKSVFSELLKLKRNELLNLKNYLIKNNYIKNINLCNEKDFYLNPCINNIFFGFIRLAEIISVEDFIKNNKLINLINVY